MLWTTFNKEGFAGGEIAYLGFHQPFAKAVTCHQLSSFKDGILIFVDISGSTLQSLSQYTK